MIFTRYIQALVQAVVKEISTGDYSSVISLQEIRHSIDFVCSFQPCPFKGSINLLLDSTPFVNVTNELLHAECISNVS